MTYKEFYYWLDGYLTNKLENKHIDIVPIVEKMGEVKESDNFGISKPYTVPVPINPIIRTDDPSVPPWQVTCDTKKI